MLNVFKESFGPFFYSIPFVAWLGLFALGGGIVGFGSFTFNYAEGFSYFSDDPKACTNCHVMREMYDGWGRGSHRAVAACNDCHTPHSSIIAKYAIKALNGFNHSKAFTVNEIPEAIRITPLNRAVAHESCLYCHGEMVSWIAHEDKQNPTDCLTCHAGVGHGK